VADKKHGAAGAGDLVHLAEAAFLEFGIADGQDLIDDEDLWVQMGCHGKGQPDLHPAGVPLDRCVNELFHPGKAHDVVEFAADLGLGHPQDGPVEVDVFPAGEFGMEAGPHLEEASHPTADLGVAAGRLGDPAKDF